MKRKISFVTIASGEVGMGHLMRSLSLAEMLQDEFSIQFIINTDKSGIIEMLKDMHYQVTQLASVKDSLSVLSNIENIDIVVLDFYGLTEDFQLQLKEKAFKIICIDDLHEIHFYADAIINISNSVKISDYSCEKYTKLYLGSSFALLRPSFLQVALSQRKEIKIIDGIFINMGGADLANNTLKFLKAILASNAINKVHVVIGMVNPYFQLIKEFVSKSESLSQIYVYHNIDSEKMLDVLSECELAICPASGISMELCAVGIGMITGFTAENQVDLLRGLVRKNCAFNWGDFNLLKENEITKAFDGILSNVTEINNMIKNQKMLIDGKSPERIKYIFDNL